jgi:hypothetical protein
MRRKRSASRDRWNRFVRRRITTLGRTELWDNKEHFRKATGSVLDIENEALNSKAHGYPLLFLLD